LKTQTTEDTKNSPQPELVYAVIDFYTVMSKLLLKGVNRENITIQQAAVLRILAKKGPVQMNRLCRELSVTPPNITTFIDRLEKKGLVKRAEDRSDRRKTEIQLTSNGKKLYEATIERYREQIQESFGILTPEEQERLAQLIGKVKAEISRKEIFECSPSKDSAIDAE
jgi:MarR family 2-MHQ and catechol resistance regulon transcriptional repressor